MLYNKNIYILKRELFLCYILITILLDEDFWIYSLLESIHDLLNNLSIRCDIYLNFNFLDYLERYKNFFSVSYLSYPIELLKELYLYSYEYVYSILIIYFSLCINLTEDILSENKDIFVNLSFSNINILSNINIFSNIHISSLFTTLTYKQNMIFKWKSLKHSILFHRKHVSLLSSYPHTNVTNHFLRYPEYMFDTLFPTRQWNVWRFVDGNLNVISFFYKILNNIDIRYIFYKDDYLRYLVSESKKTDDVLSNKKVQKDFPLLWWRVVFFSDHLSSYKSINTKKSKSNILYYTYDDVSQIRIYVLYHYYHKLLNFKYINLFMHSSKIFPTLRKKKTYSQLNTRMNYISIKSVSSYTI